jgi:hypothetical protein
MTLDRQTVLTALAIVVQVFALAALWYIARSIDLF